MQVVNVGILVAGPLVRALSVAQANAAARAGRKMGACGTKEAPQGTYAFQMKMSASPTTEAVLISAPTLLDPGYVLASLDMPLVRMPPVVMISMSALWEHTTVLLTPYAAIRREPSFACAMLALVR